MTTWGTEYEHDWGKCVACGCRRPLAKLGPLPAKLALLDNTQPPVKRELKASMCADGWCNSVIPG